ncbi:hypothetical protein CON65_09270 [Bacillus pseudomycoides]|uniref:Uncharacterized protein n=1 Tax=Bacillus pseudomycoides TaxID=64104 RepID=A0AA91ZTK1_9BACI|nr:MULTISPECIES: hypothetical protein [Bacillus]PEB47977.1 hypothetical protein COO03_24600 [Bacillus sp. AFS098217]PED82855.1 hypothetical protein CON65_09270 [Bacillus pseudomycoides]PEU09692.1 hypothetical protein CN524_17795 [Bacillus sp. AFS019443]PEU18387.1 hypothetical protein CN525_11595 [Bacillus sp. AFS014408]PFW62631.1 hypothetical protein COL20_11945 [Bacillus sp. AFS075034]
MKRFLHVLKICMVGVFVLIWCWVMKDIIFNSYLNYSVWLHWLYSICFSLSSINAYRSNKKVFAFLFFLAVALNVISVLKMYIT